MQLKIFWVMCIFWPTCLIYDIFVVKPNTINVQNVAAFVYGNGVPVQKAVDCFVACIELDSFYVSCAKKDWYPIWNNNPYTAHSGRYYSMTLKCWMCVNGKFRISKKQCVQSLESCICN